MAQYINRHDDDRPSNLLGHSLYKLNSIQQSLIKCDLRLVMNGHLIWCTFDCTPPPASKVQLCV